MFIISKDKKEAQKVDQKTFQELGIRERQHLQEWICENTDMLGEELLIIQKEFSGFDETKERLDLLALDKYGNLVIIENKLDDSGRDVMWQALKYASYCSGLSKGDVKKIYQSYLDQNGKALDAEEELKEFLTVGELNEAAINEDDQRIILIAANFRKEVTSTVMWLLERGIKIQCIKVTPFVLNGQIIVDTDQIIPVKDVEEYLIKIASKKQEEIQEKEKRQERELIRKKFWDRLIPRLKEKTEIFNTSNPQKDYWVAGSGYPAVQYNLVLANRFARIEFYLRHNEKEINKKVYDRIFQNKDGIEKSFGNTIEWQRLNDRKASRISFYLNEVDTLKEENWEEIIQFFCEYVERFFNVLEPHLKEAVRQVYGD